MMEEGKRDTAGGWHVPFSIKIVPSALAELKAVKVYARRQIADAIEGQLAHQPTVVTRNRKPLPGAEPSFAYEPPVWELRVGAHRVFYDVDEAAQVVYVRAVREKPPHARTEDVL
jgi:mRNA-degrading endonuclease RelE of RelBE toxin-antitoxin system